LSQFILRYINFQRNLLGSFGLKKRADFVTCRHHRFEWQHYATIYEVRNRRLAKWEILSPGMRLYVVWLKFTHGLEAPRFSF